MGLVLLQGQVLQCCIPHATTCGYTNSEELQLRLCSIWQPFHKKAHGGWGTDKRRVTAALGGYSVGMADMGHVVNMRELMFTITLEEAAWHKDVNSDIKKPTLHLISCSAPRELLHFSVASQMGPRQPSLSA